MSPRKKDGPPPDYPQGPQTVTFKALEEDDWWALLHALEVRIRFFQQQKAGYERLDDPDMKSWVLAWNTRPLPALLASTSFT